VLEYQRLQRRWRTDYGRENRESERRQSLTAVTHVTISLQWQTDWQKQAVVMIQGFNNVYSRWTISSRWANKLLV